MIGLASEVLDVPIARIGSCPSFTVRAPCHLNCLQRISNLILLKATKVSKPPARWHILETRRHRSTTSIKLPHPLPSPHQSSRVLLEIRESV